MALQLHHAALGNQLNGLRRPCARRGPGMGRLCQVHSGTRRIQLYNRATAADQPAPQKAGGSDEEFVGIPPEEDVEVPGGYMDALNPNTKLGKAVRAAVDELNHLNSMEMESLQQCDALLKKLGLKSSILQAPAQPQPKAEVESEEP
ncbi:hypothetical protein PLESTB_000963300 [Pleodorina starrii]|uniref:Uncharacterized protein n=1 Tax=Pleodorina starrii TaxID=330485 RepID=A0A9W6F3N3_9CHLO|nr:hypothetical protein PLESTM_001134700 [Pleodorina starrii]GLC55242.1 hypothetical protein PLESTB_000963300 [Pleodorina starrii]